MDEEKRKSFRLVCVVHFINIVSICQIDIFNRQLLSIFVLSMIINMKNFGLNTTSNDLYQQPPI